MSTWSRLNRGETQIDFVGHRKRWFLFSAVLLAISIASIAVRDLNLGIEFEGGVGIRAPNPAGADVGEIRDALDVVGVPNATIQLIDDGASVSITTEELEGPTADAAVAAVADVTGADRSEISVRAVGASFGAIILRRSLIALGVFLGAVVLFRRRRSN